MLDWGVPDERDAENSLETYVDTYLPRAIDAVQRETGCDEITLAGYCLGGTIATLYASGHDDAPLRNLVLACLPDRLRRMDAMVAGVQDGRVEVEDVVDETGLIPAKTVYGGFFMQAPTVEVARHATLLDRLWNDAYVDGWQAMAQWSRDHVPFPGAAARQIIDLFIRQNALMSGSVRLGGREIRLEEARGDVLNAFAVKDNVVPDGRRRAQLEARRQSRAAPRASPRRRARDLLDGKAGVRAHAPDTQRMDRRAQRRARDAQGGLMEIRSVTEADEPTVERFVARIPEGDRTFFKEDVNGTDVVAFWRRRGGRHHDRDRGRRGRRLRRRHPAPGLVESRR